MKSAGWFTRFANHASQATGHPSAFVIAAVVVAVWAITGPLFKFSDTWQLVINTGTTIITFLMVFLIQNTQNRDSAAIHERERKIFEKHGHSLLPQECEEAEEDEPRKARKAGQRGR